MAGDCDVAHQYPVIQEVLPHPLGISHAAVKHEVGIRLGGFQTQAFEIVDNAVPLHLDVFHRAEQCVRVFEGRQGRGLADGGEVIGQPHQSNGIRDLGGRGEVAQAGPGQGKGLTHGASDNQPRAASEQGQR